MKKRPVRIGGDAGMPEADGRNFGTGTQFGTTKSLPRHSHESFIKGFLLLKNVVSHLRLANTYQFNRLPIDSVVLRSDT